MYFSLVVGIDAIPGIRDGTEQHSINSITPHVQMMLNMQRLMNQYTEEMIVQLIEKIGSPGCRGRSESNWFHKMFAKRLYQ